jgi:hypothetical protein
MGVDRGMVAFYLKGRLVRLAMVAVPFEKEEELAVRDSLNLGRSMTKGRLQVTLPEVIGLPHMAVDINDPHLASLPHGFTNLI